MKVTKTALLVALAFASGAAMASVGGNGMLGGRHDFATRSNFLGSQPGGNAGQANKVGLCSFCHTPHSAQTTALLWNKAYAGTYTWDEATTTAGTALKSPGLTGPSLKCLACHDGAVAIGDVGLYMGKLNKNYNTFTVGQQPIGVKKSDTNGGTTGFTADDQKTNFIIGAGSILSKTHPVGVPYPYKGVNNTYNGTGLGTNVVLADFVAEPPVAGANDKGGGPVAITDRANGLGTKTALIKLYNQANTEGSAVKAGVAEGLTGMECSTCHDPHNKQTVDDWMLRGKVDGSVMSDGYICVQCHAK